MKTPSFLASLTLALLLGTGCTHVIKPPSEPFTRYPARPRIPLSVAVNLTDELRKAECVNHVMGDTFKVPIGGAIAQNAPVLTQNAFENSVSINNGNLAGHKVEAVLTPKLTFANRTLGKTAFSESVTTFKTEWELKDPEGNRIWIETVTGQSRGSTGGSRPETIVANALEALLLGSQQAIYGANSIHQYVGKLRPNYVPAKIEIPSFSSPEITDLYGGLFLTDKNAVIRSLHKLRSLKATETLPHMHVCFDHPHRAVIHEVFHVMADIGNTDTIPLIEPALKSPRKEVREEAETAIKRLQKK